MATFYVANLGGVCNHSGGQTNKFIAGDMGGFWDKNAIILSRLHGFRITPGRPQFRIEAGKPQYRIAPGRDQYRIKGVA